MNTDLKLPSIFLRHGEARRIEAGKGLRVQCLTGTLWLTQDNDRRDFVLEAGDGAVIESDGPSVLTGLSDAQYVLLYGLH